VTLAQEWEVVGEVGVTKFVFVSPEGLKDKHFVAQVLHAITNKYPKGALQVFIYDDKAYTPRGFPMTDKQMLHQRARYNRNPSTSLSEFAWISVVDAKSSPPKLKETKANIGPGSAD
jgi:hypothetical protein